MNSPDPSVVPTELPSAPPPSGAGRMLRAAREAQGIQLAMLSVNLKVSVRQLEALEADRYDAFKGIAFVRALAQSVCRQLKIDPEPVLQALPRSDAPKALEPQALEAHRTTVVTGTHSGVGLRLPRQVLVMAVLMLAGAAALIWWPANRPDVLRLAEAVQDPAQAAVPMGQASDPVEVSAPMALAASAELPAVPAAPSVVPAPVQPKPQPPASTPAPVAAAPAPVLAPAPVASQAPASSKDTPLVIKVSADVWISVRDNHGQTLVRRQVKAGETLKLEVAPPLFVYASRAEGIELAWHGKSVDLRPHTQNNEVRLQIKP